MKRISQIILIIISLCFCLSSKAQNETTTPTFGGYEIAPGPLWYNGTEYGVKSHWNYTSYDKCYGKTKGSTYFNFIELGQLFDSRTNDFNENSGDINNQNSITAFGKEGWMLPSMNDWKIILTTEKETRTGSIVNRNNNKHWVYVEIKGIGHLYNSPIKEINSTYGLILFPDNKEIIGKNLFVLDKEINDERNTLTETELNKYLSQGCMFLPFTGYYEYDSYYEDGGWSAEGNGLYSSSSTKIIKERNYECPCCFSILGNIEVNDMPIIVCCQSKELIKYYCVRLIRKINDK